MLGKLSRRCVLLIWIREGQVPTALAVCAGGVVCTFLSRLSFLFSYYLPLRTARYRLKYCLKGPLSPKQPSNQIVRHPMVFIFLNLFDLLECPVMLMTLKE